jgi:hypothetical protein
MLFGENLQIFEPLTRLIYRHSKTVLIVLLSVVLTILLTTTFSIWLDRRARLGIIRAVEIKAYGGDIIDSTENSNTQFLNWGTLSPGAEANCSFYIRSNSNQDVILNLNATNWNPTSISNFLNLTWNYKGTPLSPRQTIFVTLTLSVSSSPALIDYLITNDVKNFSFDINITPTQ